VHGFKKFSTMPGSSNTLTCKCVFDREYILGKHGILDILKTISSLVAIIVLVTTTYSNGLVQFLFIASCVSLFGSAFVLIVLGTCYNCMSCCANINWKLYSKWWNFLLGWFYLIAAICGCAGSVTYLGTTSHTPIVVAIVFSFLCVVWHFLDWYFYRRDGGDNSNVFYGCLGCFKVLPCCKCLEGGSQRREDITF